MPSIAASFKDPKGRVVMVILMIFGFVGGMYVAAYGIKAAGLAGSIGGLSPEEVDEGFWLRYDLIGWSQTHFENDGGTPYMIATVTGVTDWTTLGDAPAGASTSKAYTWDFKVYNSNGLLATGLTNVSFNIAYNLFFKPMIVAYQNRSTVNALQIYNRLRPFIDTDVLGWRTAGDITRLNPSYLGTGNLVSFNSTPVGYDISMSTTSFLGKNSSDFMTTNNNWTNQIEYHIAYDRDSGFMLYTSADVWYKTLSGGSAYWMAMALTGFGNSAGGEALVGKGMIPPPPPSKPIVQIVETVGKSYEYEVLINNNDYDYAMISLDFNQSLTDLTGDKAVKTDAKSYPIDNKAINTRVVATVITFRQGVQSASTAVMKVMTKVNPLAAIAPVTLLTADAIGTSINATWTSNVNASAYRVFINSTYYGDTTTDTGLIFNLPIGSIPLTGLVSDFNITIVVDSFDYNQSSVPSNSILVSFNITANEIDQTNYADGASFSDANTTEIFDEGASVDNQQINFGIIVASIAIGVGVIVAVFYFRSPKGKETVKKISSIAGKRKTDARCRI